MQVLAASWVAAAQGYLAEASQDYGPWKPMTISGAGAVNKTGPGRLTLTGASTYGDPTGYSAYTTVSQGVLQADRGVGLPANSGLNLNGGVFQSNSDVTFSDPFWMWAPDSHEVIWNGGGFSAALKVMTARVAGSTFSSAWQHGQTTSNNPVPFVLAIPES